MSLINDVLKDLDDRRAGNEVIQQVPGGATVAPVRKTKERIDPLRLLLTLILVIGIVALAAFLYHLYGDYRRQMSIAEDQSREAKAILDQATPLATAEQPPAPVPEVPESAQISAVFVTQLDQGARIEVQLSRRVEHQVSAIGKQQLMIRLPNTELTSLLPSLAEHPMIDAIDLVSEKSGLALKVMLAQPATFQTYLLKRGQYHALVVELFAIAQEVPAAEVPVALSEPEQGEPVVEKLSEISEPEQKIPQAPEHPQIFNKTASTPSLAEQDRTASREALKLMRSGRAEQAVENLQRFIDEQPQAHASRETLVVWALSQQRLDLAETLLARGIELAPQYPPYLKLQARTLTSRGKQAQALALLQAGVAQNNRDSEYLALLASLYQQQQQHTQAEAVYRTLLQRDAGQAQWWVGRAISLEALGLKQEALGAYVQARRIPGIDARLKGYAESRIQQLN